MIFEGLYTISMKLIIGIGNPGDKYQNTRHNVGFMVVDRLQTKANGEDWRVENKFSAVVSKLSSADVLLAKPQTFVNESGVAVSKIANFYKIAPFDIYVIHDDLDIMLGEYKIQKGIGPKLHYGIQSIDKVLGTDQYWRVRVGIENRGSISTNIYQFPISKLKTIVKNTNFQLRTKTTGEEYVLQEFEKGELEILEKTVDNVVGEILKKLANV